VKLDLINVAEYLESECPAGHILLSIHDEQNISMPFQDAKRHMDHIRDLIQSRPGSPVKIRIPIRADFSTLADDWWQATNNPSIHS
jgi:DNA polymerase I-like protein with 3'-5' exonuclease and polymerase domains